MIQRRSAKLLTSSQAVSTQPRAILGLLLVRNQMLVIFAACERPRYQIPSSLSLPVFHCFSISSSLCLPAPVYVCSAFHAQVNLY